MPSDRAVSSSATRIAAPWFTNGLAVSSFEYGNTTMRLAGPTSSSSASLTTCRDQRVGILGRDQRHLCPHPRRLRLAVRQRRALAGAQRVLVEREEVERAPDAHLERLVHPFELARDARAARWPGAAFPTSAGRAGPVRLRTRDQGDAGLPRRDPRGHRVERAQRALTARRPRAQPLARHRKPERVGDRAGDVVVAPRADPHHLDRVDGLERVARARRRPRRGGVEDQRRALPRPRRDGRTGRHR